MGERAAGAVTEVERLRSLLAHMVWVVEDGRSVGHKAFDVCQLCRTAKEEAGV